MVTPIPPFHPVSEALMSNLASRSHEWLDWQIEEILFELPVSARSRGSRHERFRIVLNVSWKLRGHLTCVLKAQSSATKVLLERKDSSKEALKTVRILAKRWKSSKGDYRENDAARIANFLALTEDSQP